MIQTVAVTDKFGGTLYKIVDPSIPSQLGRRGTRVACRSWPLMRRRSEQSHRVVPEILLRHRNRTLESDWRNAIRGADRVAGEAVRGLAKPMTDLIRALAVRYFRDGMNTDEAWQAASSHVEHQSSRVVAAPELQHTARPPSPIPQPPAGPTVAGAPTFDACWFRSRSALMATVTLSPRAQMQLWRPCGIRDHQCLAGRFTDSFARRASRLNSNGYGSRKRCSGASAKS